MKLADLGKLSCSGSSETTREIPFIALILAEYTF